MKLRNRILAGTGLVVVVAVAALVLVLGYTAPCEPAPGLSAESTAMKAIDYRCYGSPEVLALEDVEKPAPADGEVLVKVHAASVNPLDWHYMRGSPYIMRLESGIGRPKVTRLGVDFSGTVEAVGASVTRFKPGDEVFGGRTGAFGEYIPVREDRGIASKPANVSFAEAAAVPIAGVTALQAVRDKGKVEAGQKVLINGASGGVGTFAVQIAKSFGAEVTGVCSERNVEMVRSLGGDHVIDYGTEDFTAGEQRYDVIIDMVGNHPLSALRDVLVPGGIVVMVGGPPGDWLGPLINPLKALFVNPFIDEHFSFFVATMDRDDLGLLADLMAEGKITPVIDRHYPLSEVPDAIAYSEKGRARGKIIIDVQPPARNPWTDAAKRGVSFRALGNEPFWSLEIAPGRLTMITDSGQRRTERSYEEPVVEGATTTYRSLADDGEIVAVIERSPCTDSMSGEAFEATATVMFGGTTYRGCGRFL